ncbi:MAG TPA: hypothetical protein GXX29_14735 [Firmicutes bacterium]|nr:hypothetical protein [Bacillota bacterium]
MRRTRFWLMTGLIILLAAAGSFFYINKAAGDARRQQVEPARLKEDKTPRERDLEKIKLAVTSGLAMPPDKITLEEARYIDTGRPERPGTRSESASGLAGWWLTVEGTSEKTDAAVILEDARHVFAELADTGVDLAQISLSLFTDDLTDVYGRPIEHLQVLRLILDKETFAKISWNRFDPLDFPKVAVDFWVHERVARQMAEMEKKKRQEELKTQPDAVSDPGGT